MRRPGLAARGLLECRWAELVPSTWSSSHAIAPPSNFELRLREQACPMRRLFVWSFAHGRVAVACSTYARAAIADSVTTRCRVATRRVAARFVKPARATSAHARGRRDHAERQRRYRNNVTHQGRQKLAGSLEPSHATPAVIVSVAVALNERSLDALQIHRLSVVRCVRCGRGASFTLHHLLSASAHTRRRSRRSRGPPRR